MHLFQKLFSSKYNQDAATADNLIEEALQHSRKPKSGAQSALIGADTRQRVFSIIETVESEINQLVVLIAQDTGVLMIHPKLFEEITKHPDAEMIERALYLCFPTPAASRLLNEKWPIAVARYKNSANTDEILRQKAILLATFVTNNLDAGITEIRTHAEQYASEMTEEHIQQKECLVRLEEAACWYRVIDEFAYRSLRHDERSLFMDHFQDYIARLLALQGTPPELICGTMADRTDEYGGYRKWIPDGVRRLRIFGQRDKLKANRSKGA